MKLKSFLRELFLCNFTSVRTDTPEEYQFATDSDIQRFIRGWNKTILIAGYFIYFIIILITLPGDDSKRFTKYTENGIYTLAFCEGIHYYTGFVSHSREVNRFSWGDFVFSVIYNKNKQQYDIGYTKLTLDSTREYLSSTKHRPLRGETIIDEVKEVGSDGDDFGFIDILNYDEGQYVPILFLPDDPRKFAPVDGIIAEMPRAKYYYTTFWFFLITLLLCKILFNLNKHIVNKKSKQKIFKLFSIHEITTWVLGIYIFFLWNNLNLQRDRNFRDMKKNYYELIDIKKHAYEKKNTAYYANFKD